MLHTIPDEILTMNIYSFLNQNIICSLVSTNTFLKQTFMNEYKKNVSASVIQKYYRYYKPKLPSFNNWNIDDITTNNKNIIIRFFITRFPQRFLQNFPEFYIKHFPQKKNQILLWIHDNIPNDPLLRTTRHFIRFLHAHFLTEKQCYYLLW